MAAQNLTAAALLDVQARLTSLFAPGSGPSAYERNIAVDTQTARAVLGNHIANVDPITDSNGNCLGFRAYHITGKADTLDYNGDGSDLTLTCDITSGDGLQATQTIYEFNTQMVKTRTLNDDQCGNLFRDAIAADTREEVVTLVADNLFYAILAVEKALNTKLINFFNTNKTTVNNDGSLPSQISFGSNRFNVTETPGLGNYNTQNPDVLTDWETIALNNSLTNWFLLSGRKHFYNAFINSQYKVLNDDRRDEIRWGQTPLFFDPKNLDSTISAGAGHSFVIDPASYIFYDHVDPALSMLPYQVDENKWEFLIESPNLMLNTAGGMRPVRYTVHYQKECSNVNTSRMRNQFDHHFRVILNSGLHVAPPAADGHTGILQFRSV